LTEDDDGDSARPARPPLWWLLSYDLLVELLCACVGFTDGDCDQAVLPRIWLGWETWEEEPF